MDVRSEWMGEGAGGLSGGLREFPGGGGERAMRGPGVGARCWACVGGSGGHEGARCCVCVGGG